MGILLWLFLFIAIAIIFYSIGIYKKTPTHRFNQAQKDMNLCMIEKGTVIKLTYKGVSFEGLLSVGTDETSIKVEKVAVSLTDPFERLKGWSRDDFYMIEREIYTQYPYAEIQWKQPISQFLDQLDLPVIDH